MRREKVIVTQIGKGMYITNIRAITVDSGKKRKSLFKLFARRPKLVSPQKLFDKTE